MSMGDPNAIYKIERVTVRIVSAQMPGYWYAKMVGETLHVEKTTTTYTDKPDVYVKYTPVNYRSMHIVPSDVEEIAPAPRPVRKIKKTKKKGKR